VNGTKKTKKNINTVHFIYNHNRFGPWPESTCLSLIFLLLLFTPKGRLISGGSVERQFYPDVYLQMSTSTYFPSVTINTYERRIKKPQSTPVFFVPSFLGLHPTSAIKPPRPNNYSLLSLKVDGLRAIQASGPTTRSTCLLRTGPTFNFGLLRFARKVHRTKKMTGKRKRKLKLWF